jgi:hypothetical protein
MRCVHICTGCGGGGEEPTYLAFARIERAPLSLTRARVPTRSLKVTGTIGKVRKDWRLNVEYSIDFKMYFFERTLALRYLEISASVDKKSAPAKHTND